MKNLLEILKESYVWERKFSDKLPTLKDVMKKKSLREKSDKIQVRGIGIYDHNSLSKKLKSQASDIAKYAKDEKWNKLAKRDLTAFAQMWDALSKFEEE